MLVNFKITQFREKTADECIFISKGANFTNSETSSNNALIENDSFSVTNGLKS